MATGTNNTPHRDLWEQGPPPAPDSKRVAGEPGVQSILALTLREALNEMQKEAEEQEASQGHDGADDETETQEVAAPNEPLDNEKALVMDQVTADSIMQAFGDSLAESQQRRHRGETAAPAALLKGRLRHYNRHGDKWLIVVDDAEIRERVPLDKKRRKRERPSLWDISQESSPNQAPPSTKCTLQLLAYNDIE